MPPQIISNSAENGEESITQVDTKEPLTNPFMLNSVRGSVSVTEQIT